MSELLPLVAHIEALTHSKLNVEINSIDEEKLKEWLSERISFLLEYDFQCLLQVLYRVDINEEELRQSIASMSNLDSVAIICDMIIKREKSKIVSRKRYKSNHRADDVESW
tara:strand:+ start:380 stop:712 length:333 start_codon:yes stop_codon:yes gene_type:complete